MDIITVDVETYYDKDYSLSKMTTEAYVRDPRFEVIGVSVKVNGSPTDWYSGSDPGRFLKSLDYSGKAILCHNTAFDGAILSWRFGIRPRLWLDTLSMARALHSITVGGSLKMLAAHYKLGIKGDEVVRAIGKRRADFSKTEIDTYGDYCINDTNLTYDLFRKMKASFSVGEIKLIDQTMRMYTEPSLVLDTNLLTGYLKEVQESKSTLVEQMGLSCTEDEAKKILMSNEKFALYLACLGVAAPQRVSKTSGKLTFAFSKTDSEFIKLLDHDDERVANAVAARLGVKSTINETRTKSLLAVASRGALPVMLNYYGAYTTGRFSGGDKMNLQNLPRGGTLRRSLCAPPGKVLVACDSSQIEARIVAWLAGQSDLLQWFREGQDVYSKFATTIYGRKITKADKQERHVGKTAILGLGYGMGGDKFMDTLAIGAGGVVVKMDLPEALGIVKLYRARNHKIASFWNKCNNALHWMCLGKEGELHPVLPYGPDWIGLPNGLRIRYPLLHLGAHGVGYQYVGDAQTYKKVLKNRVLDVTKDVTIKYPHLYGGKVTENVTQALARIVVSEQMTKIGERYKVVLQVHDEIVIIVDETEADNASAFMVKIMSTPPTWAPDLPVACEAAIGRNFGECK